MLQYIIIAETIIILLAWVATHILCKECEIYQKEITSKDKVINKLFWKQKLDSDVITWLWKTIEEWSKETNNEYQMKCYYNRELKRVKKLCKENNIDYKVNK